MQESRVSVTALVTAYARAYHSMHDDPRIFDDFVAPQLFTEQEHEFFRHNVALSLSFLDPELAASIKDEASALAAVMRLQMAPVTLSRSRYTEEMLDHVVAAGVQQYVILGAGMDTFAFRKPEMLSQVQVFEVDHPATQADKRRRIAERGWAEPNGLHWIPVDFAKLGFAAALKDSAYDPTKQSLFSWLGVTYYLTREQILATLKDIAKVAPNGTSIIFDYMDADAFIPERATPLIQRVQAIVKTAGEPMKTGFDPATLPSDLAAVGLSLTEDLSQEDIQARYFAGRTDGYHAFEHTHFVTAKVV
jgi:methyltransferase (TIGR00027 family)